MVFYQTSLGPPPPVWFFPVKTIFCHVFGHFKPFLTLFKTPNLRFGFYYPLCKRTLFPLFLDTFPKGKLLSTHAFSSLLLIFCKIEYLHPAQVKVSHEAILPEKENLVQFFRRETGAMVSGD